MDTSVVMDVYNTTPLLIGWYDPRQVDPLGLRPTEIKGLWRYWARVVIAGALYDRELLAGVKVKGVNRITTVEEAKTISHLVGAVLGLGYAGTDGGEQSRFKIMVEPLTPVRPITQRFRELQRIGLLTIKEPIGYIEEGAKFRIRVWLERSKYRNAEELALKILVLALQLNGVGKGGRRGLGSLDIHTITGIEIPSKLSVLINDVYAEALNIVDTHVEKRDLPKKVEQGFHQILPPMPSLSKKQFQGINISSVRISDIMFRDAHNFFLRSYRCRKLTGNPACFDDIRQSLVSWFLGLPREQKGGGYVIPQDIKERDVTRRASPIYVAHHEKGNIFGPGTYFTVLVSGDWPERVVWEGKEIYIDDQTIVKAYNVVINELEAYARACKSSVVKVWP